MTNPNDSPAPKWADRDLHRTHDDFRVATAICNMHDAIVAQLADLARQQERTNQLLEWIGQRLSSDGGQ